MMNRNMRSAGIQIVLIFIDIHDENTINKYDITIYSNNSYQDICLWKENLSFSFEMLPNYLKS